MATRKVPEGVPGTVAPMPAKDGEIEDEDFSFAGNIEEKPKTGQEIYRALVANGFIGAWKDRTDIGDSLEYARLLRKRASERLRGQ